MNLHQTLNRTVFCVLLVSVIATANGQPDAMSNAIKTYTPGQQRLSAISTARFINTITQNSQDEDSVQAIACRITGLPFLLPYKEGPEAESPEEIKISRLLDSALYFLHQPGTHPEDLAKAAHFLAAAYASCAATQNAQWQNECLFVRAELLVQSGKTKESRAVLYRLIQTGEKASNWRQTARACLHLADFLPRGDTTKFTLYKRSKELFHLAHDKEQEIIAQQGIFDCHDAVDVHAMEHDLRLTLELMRDDGFQHTLYINYLLAYTFSCMSNYPEALTACRLAFDNMKWSGIEALKGCFFTRMGACLEGFGKYDDALEWFRKATNSGTTETRIFWYKSLLFGSTLLHMTGRPLDALSMIDSVTSKFPPLSLWEKIQILSEKGICYAKLGNPARADEDFTAILHIIQHCPTVDPYGEMDDEYYEMARFYIQQRNLKKTGAFLVQFNRIDRKANYIYKYNLLYKIDSSKGKFLSAIQNHLLYERFADSSAIMDQRKKMNELTLRYAAEKKDGDIKLLTQEQVAQKAELQHKRMRRNILIVGTSLLLLVGGLIFRQFKLKQKTNKAAGKKSLELQQVVTEKDWLVKEVHHRVKNNLQTVICLLESQARYLEENAARAIEISRNRIYAMSLIHQQLYQSEDAATVEMSAYLAEFILHLDAEMDARKRIRYRLDIPPLKLGIGQAIPVALIINEAVTNSIKYAFPPDREGLITIEIRLDNDKVVLQIADNGVGIDAALLGARPDSLGLTLIGRFCEEIHGEMKITSDGGTTITVIFETNPLMQGMAAEHLVKEQAVLI